MLPHFGSHVKRAKPNPLERLVRFCYTGYQQILKRNLKRMTYHLKTLSLFLFKLQFYFFKPFNYFRRIKSFSAVKAHFSRDRYGSHVFPASQEFFDFFLNQLSAADSAFFIYVAHVFFLCDCYLSSVDLL